MQTINNLRRFAKPNSKQFIEHLQFRNRQNRRRTHNIGLNLDSGNAIYNLNQNGVLVQGKFPGGFTFLRNSVATDVNASNALLNYSVNELRNNSGWLLESAATNLVLNSAVLATQNIAVTAQLYVLSFTGSGSVALSGAFVGNLAGTGANNRVSLPFTPAAGSLTITPTGDVRLAQLEANNFASSYMPTGGSVAIRQLDNWKIAGVDFTNLFPNGLQGYALVELLVSALPAATPSRILSFNDGTTTNNFEISITSTAVEQFFSTVAGSVSTTTSLTGVITANQKFRTVLRFSNGEIACCRNGGTIFKLASAIPAVTSFQLFNRADLARASNGRVNLISIGNYLPTDAEMQAGSIVNADIPALFKAY